MKIKKTCENCNYNDDKLCLKHLKQIWDDGESCDEWMENPDVKKEEKHDIM